MRPGHENEAAPRGRGRPKGSRDAAPRRAPSNAGQARLCERIPLPERAELARMVALEVFSRRFPLILRTLPERELDTLERMLEHELAAAFARLEGAPRAPEVGL